MSEPPYIDADGQVAWVAEHADLPYDVVAEVLALEFEYIVAVGTRRHPATSSASTSRTISEVRPGP